MSKYNSRNEYVTENLANWLKDFADKEASKLAAQHGVTEEDIKNGGHLENIIDIVERRKKISIEDKVKQYRELAGLDLINNIEKEGEQQKEKTASSRIVISQHEKNVKQYDEKEEKKIMEHINQFVKELVKNRNAYIASPAIIDQIINYIKVDREWLNDHVDEIKDIIEKAKEKFSPDISEPPINDLAKNDEHITEEKELTQFSGPIPNG